MDIVLKPVSGSPIFYFPSLPERIKGSMSAKYQSFDIISKGAVKAPKGTEVSEISWDGEFFGPSKQNEPIIRKGHYQEPNKCIAQLKKWYEDGETLNLIVTETWINMDVTLSNFSPEVYGAYGNVEYSISFAEHKDLKIFTTSELKIAAFVKKTVPRNDGGQQQSSSKGSYTVKSGDNLWKIARQFYGGSGSDWKKIYDANRDVIESTANKYRKGKGSDNGHWIYPGEAFAIPA